MYVRITCQAAIIRRVYCPGGGSNMKSPTANDGSKRGKRDLERLLLAIVHDGRVVAGKLLKEDSCLSRALVDQARLYESKIVHWLYANDTALHLAAAGHRVAIAQMLLKAGADPNMAGNHRQ